MNTNMFTCLHCHETKPAEAFFRGSKNPTKCLACRKIEMSEKRFKKTDTSQQFRKTISFSTFSLALISSYQKGGSVSEACELIFLQAYQNLDPKMKEIVNFYERQLQAKSASISD